LTEAVLSDLRLSETGACTHCPLSEFQLLPNGNLIVANWQGNLGGGTGIQVLEFSPAGDVVWMFKLDPKIIHSIQGVMVLDGLDARYLHVLETSDDSTWQPVNPAP
jgi:hypothetical protein